MEAVKNSLIDGVIADLFKKNQGFLDKRFSLTISCPEEGQKSWELSYCAIAPNFKEYNPETIINAIKKSLTFEVVLTDEKIIVKMNGLRVPLTHKDFLENFKQTEDFLLAWFEVCFNTHEQ